MKDWVEFIYRKFALFGIGERTRTFFSGFQWSISAAFVSKIITGLTTIMAARLLGPHEFGEANLSLAAALWIEVPIFLGIHTAIVHFVSKVPAEEKPLWISEGVNIMTLVAVLTGVVGYCFKSKWAHLLGIPEPFFVLALAWSFCFWAFTVLKSLLNALERFMFRSWIEILFATLFPLSFIFWIHQGLRSAAYVLGLSIPYLIVGVAGLIFLHPGFGKTIIIGHRSKKLIFYGLLYTTGSVISALIETPARLITNRTLELADVGVLSAYQGGSTQMAMFLLMAASQVFFPIASRTPDKIGLFKKLNYLLWRSFPLLVPVFVFGVFAYISILGRNYPVRISFCVTFGLAAALSLINGILIWFVNSYGWRGILLNAMVGLTSGIVNVVACLWAIPRFHIQGAGFAYLAAISTGTALLYLPAFQRWLNRQDTPIKVIT